jgi:anti-sigma factor RsiW
MNCLEREKIFGFTHHLLDAQETDAARAHLERCAACRAVVEEYERLDGALKELKVPEPSPWFDARLRANLAAEAEGGLWGLWGFLQWRRWLLPAMIVAVIVLAIVVSRQTPSPQPIAQKAPAQVEQASRPAPEKIRPAESAQVQKPAVKAPQKKPALDREEIASEAGDSTIDDYDLMANFEVLSELAVKGNRVAN